MTKLSARWVPRLLTVDNKRNRMTISKQCFDSFKRNPKMFLLRFVSVDETQIYHYTPEMKEQSKQWIGRWQVPRRKRRHGPRLGEERRCSSTKTTRLHADPSLPQRNWWNWATNCCHIHRIFQI
jgi:hypothetical protein